MAIRWTQRPEAIVRAGAVGLNRGANKVMEISRTRYCPKATGFLASTGEVETTVDGSTTTATLRYTADYALPVHERQARHPIGQWKYLSTPANENVDMVQAEIALAVQTEMG